MNVITNNFKFNESKLTQLKYNKVVLIILHHRCGNGDVQSIHAQHLKNGWAGIGYHYYIRKDGQIYQGRPIKYVGSHCAGNNSCSIGVCLEGDFRKEKPTDEQIKSLNELVPHIRKMYKNIKRVLNHKDLYPTACPVINLKALVKNTNSRGDLIDE